MKKILMVAAVLLVALALVPVNSFANKGEFTICNVAEPQGLDPALIQGVPEHRIYMSIFEGLVGTKAEDASPVPGVAKSWKITNDGKTYTFNLRKTTWSDGVPITAHTFVKSWLRFLDPKTAAPYAWFPNMFIAGAEDYNSGKAGPEAVKIRAIDDYTFQFDLVGPLPYVLGALAHYSFGIAPLHAIEKHGADWTKPENFVSNGPFIVEKWEPQSKLTCIPNPKYWDKDAVSLAKVTYLPIDDENTAHNVYLNGEADWNTSVPIDQIENAELRDDFQVGPYLGTYYYTINVKEKPFDDVRVRKALSMAMDREALVTKVTKAGEIATGNMVPDMAGYTVINGARKNIAEAQKLLAEAGYPGGKGFPEFTVLYNTNENHKKIAEYIQSQWAENLGVSIKLMNQEWKTYLASRRQHQFQVARAGWIGDYQDPNTFLDMFMTGGAMNGGQYANAEFDALVKKAATMADGKARMDTLRKAEQIFIEQDQGVIPIYHYVSKGMIDLNKWGGWHWNVMDYHPMKDVYMK